MNSTPPPPSTPPLSDRWHTRDFPVLLEVARRLEAGLEVDAEDVDLQAAVSLTETELVRSIEHYCPQLGGPSQEWLA